MTYACCPRCRLRFPAAAAAYLEVCPGCGEPPQHRAALGGAAAYRLFRLEDIRLAAPEAIEISGPMRKLAPEDPDRTDSPAGGDAEIHTGNG